MKQVVFICHANPEDNEFTLWLASRLKLLGYNVWCDLKELLGGEKHWEVIYKIIKNESAKFLFVVSKDICIEPGKLKDGISKEFSLAETIAKTQDNFIIPLKIDKDSSYDSFIGQNRFTHINFEENWAEGFRQLVSKLQKDSVPINQKEEVVQKAWYFEPFIKKYELINRKETYFTNLWKIDSLPKYYNIYMYVNEEQARLAHSLNISSAVIRHGNTIVSIGTPETKIRYNTFNYSTEESPIDNISMEIDTILNGTYKSETFPNTSDAQKLLKRLLLRSFHLTMREKGLSWYELSNKKLCYYYPLSQKRKIAFNVEGKEKKKSLIGNFKISSQKSGYWHFGISCTVSFIPSPCFVIKSHLLFSDDGKYIWLDKDKLHRARRRKGKRFFNQEWRDLLLGFLSSLKNEQGEIQMIIDAKLKIPMNEKPLEVMSEMGYVEPQDEERQGILDIDDSDVPEILQEG